MLLLLKNILKFILISVSPLSTLTPHCQLNVNALLLFDVFGDGELSRQTC